MKKYLRRISRPLPFVVLVEQMADMAGVSVPVFCSFLLQALDPDKFAAAEPTEEDDHGQ